MDGLNFQKVLDYLRQLFPDWKISPAETVLWKQSLDAFAYDVVRKAIDNYYCMQMVYRKRPVLAGVRKEALAIRQMQVTAREREERKNSCEPVLVYEIKCMEHPQKELIGSSQKFYCSSKNKLASQKAYEYESARLCEQFNGLNRDMKNPEKIFGRWVVIRHWKVTVA
jgi:hypothetical protein